MKKAVYGLILFAAITAFVLSLSPTVKAEPNDMQTKQTQGIASDTKTLGNADKQEEAPHQKSLSPSVKAELNSTEPNQQACKASPTRSTCKADKPEPAPQKQPATDKESHPQKLEDEKSEVNVYKDNVDNLKFAIKVIAGLITSFIVFGVAMIGYLVFKSKKDYREALTDTKGARDKAEKACEKAREYELQAQKLLVSIDKAVKDKLEEIDIKANDRQGNIDKLVADKLEEIEKTSRKQKEESSSEFERQRKISELFNKGWKASEAKDCETATECYRQIVEELKEENDPDVYNNWGYTLWELAERKESAEAEKLLNLAIDKYKKAIEIKPDQHYAHNNWGNALLELAKNKKGTQAEELLKLAIERYKKTIEIKPDYHLAHNNWGNALLELAKNKKGTEAVQLFNLAIEKCKKAVEINPDYFGAYNSLGSALLGLAESKKDKEAENLYNQAIDKYKKAIEIKPNHHLAYNNWGVALEELAKSKKGKESEKLYNQAIDKYKKAIEIKPDYFPAYDNWASALLYLAQLKGGKDAETLLKQAEEKCLKAESIKTGEGAYNLACVYAQRGNEEKCKEWLKVREKEGELPSREYAMADDDLKSVREKEWFKKLGWEGE